MVRVGLFLHTIALMLFRDAAPSSATGRHERATGSNWMAICGQLSQIRGPKFMCESWHESKEAAIGFAMGNSSEAVLVAVWLSNGRVCFRHF